jgi:hypothetical protein
MSRLAPLALLVAFSAAAPAARAQGELSPHEFVVLSVSYSRIAGSGGLSDGVYTLSGGIEAALGRIGLHVGYGIGTERSEEWGDLGAVALAAGYYIAREGRGDAEPLTLEAGISYAGSSESKVLGPFIAGSARVYEYGGFFLGPQAMVQFFFPVDRDYGPFIEVPRQLALSAGFVTGVGRGGVRPVIAPALVFVPGADEGGFGYTVSLGLAIGAGR